MKYLNLLLLALVIMLSACSQKEERGVALAQVNNEVLYLENFKATFGVGEWDKLSPELRKKYIEDWVNLTLLAQYADKEGLSDTPAVKQRINYAAKKVKANAVIGNRLAQIQVSDDQLFNYFRLHQAEFQKNTVEYALQRIACNDKLAAENVLGQLKGGMVWSEAVSRYSGEDLKFQGGNMGYVSAATDSIFWLAARNLQEGETGIVNKEQLWFVFRITDIRETAKEANFEDYRAEIKRKIILERQDQMYQDILKEIKAGKNEIYYY